MGFRVAVHVQGTGCSTLDKRKCLVFVEDKWNKVADFEGHLKRVLNVEGLELFIDDCWVSVEEPICIIKPSDTITVKLLALANDAPIHEEGSKEKKEKRSKRKKVELSPIRTAEEPEIDDVALAAKKEELLSKVEAALSPEGMDITDDVAPPTKKRRHRKRPSKKRKEMLEMLSVGGILSCITQQSDSAPHPATTSDPLCTGKTGSNHIRFDQELCEDTNNTVVDAPKENWQERLMSLAQERKKPVFVRSEVADGNNLRHQNGVEGVNGLNGDAKVNGDSKQDNGHCDLSDPCCTSYIHNSVPVETARANDVLYFKKLTVVNGQPIVSERLLGLVEEVSDLDAVVMKIFEGRVEVSFTSDEIQDCEDGCFVVKVDWRNIVEPRMIVDAALLSKYL